MPYRATIRVASKVYQFTIKEPYISLGARAASLTFQSGAELAREERRDGGALKQRTGVCRRNCYLPVCMCMYIYIYILIYYSIYLFICIFIFIYIYICIYVYIYI